MASSARRIDTLIWSVTAVAAVVMAAAPWVSDFRVVWATFAAPFGAGVALAAGAWFYRRWREDPRLAAALEGTSQILVFAAVGAPLSYLAAAANFPLLDGVFDRMDQALGFDWPALLGWMNANAGLHPAFSLAYQSFTLQATTAVLALAFTGRFRELKLFVLAFMLSALACIAVSTVTPAEGIWGFHKLATADHPAIVPVTRELHLPVFHGLRDGSFRDLVGIGAEGIITFPSFHAALGVIFILALWPIPVLRWIGLAVNLLMIAATPVDGGHYFVDVLAGIAIAFGCFAVAKSIVAGSKFSSLPALEAKPPQLAAGE